MANIFRTRALSAFRSTFRDSSRVNVVRPLSASVARPFSVSVRLNAAAAAVSEAELEPLSQAATGRDETLTGPFGTAAHPVQVPSTLTFRPVGCIGGVGNEHELLWHMVEVGKPTVCLECGQYFVLKQLAGAHGDHGHGHGHAHH
eukprot:TRINITY_DN27215_c0_g1_i1.p1 TRINITY_DN27215_c0_g1~~TRINITY_DN27215_c0_g1_i1.p1  ORF type:complete len:145 (-),score=9.13 TRINITY_DN27215_c0_g1_i1:274-708(-)